MKPTTIDFHRHARLDEGGVGMLYLHGCGHRTVNLDCSARTISVGGGGKRITLLPPVRAAFNIPTILSDSGTEATW